MRLTRVFKGEFVNSLREKKQLLDSLRKADMSLKQMKNCGQTIDCLRELAKVADVHALGKARGWRRKLQLDSVNMAGDLFEELDKAGIKATLYAGALIGFSRNGGFIPWDDDLDFFILRPDYYRLFDHFKKNHYVLYTEGESYEKDMAQVDDFCRIHKGEPVLIKYYDYAKYTIADNHVKRITIDFFPYEYIKDGTSFEEYKQYVYRFVEKVKRLPHKERNSFRDEQERMNPYASMTATSIIGPGLSRVPWFHEKAKRFIPSDYIMPPKMVEFEGRIFPCPAEHEKFLGEFKSPGYDQYPRQFANGGLSDHEEGYSEWFVLHGTKAEFIVHSEEEVRAMLPLYEELRNRNVFVEFINRIAEDDWGYILDSYEVRYVYRRNFNSQWAVCMSNLKELERYRKNKLLFTGDTEKAVKKIMEGSRV